jgi:hypothetical protein
MKTPASGALPSAAAIFNIQRIMRTACGRQSTRVERAVRAGSGIEVEYALEETCADQDFSRFQENSS